MLDEKLMKCITLWKVFFLDKNQVINKLFNILTWTVSNTLWNYSRGAVLCLVIQSPPTLYDTMECSPPGSSVHGDSPGKHTGVGCHALLQGNLSTPGMKPRFSTLQADSLYCPSHQGSPRVLEWVAYPPSPADLPNPGIKLESPALQVDSLPDELPGKPTAEV